VDSTVRTNFRPVFVVQEEIFSQLLGLRISVVTAISPSLFRREKVYGHSPDVSKRLLGARNWRTNPETQLTHALGYGKTQRFEIRLKRVRIYAKPRPGNQRLLFASLGLLRCGEF
jgi:hypothetical protein